ncbi:MAG: 4Fe-4S dicluster domain-containing protein [Chloroflexota bacterium]|nr:4Fe-4S dicluster domain-containing protein [Chloroflexota bacterium]
MSSTETTSEAVEVAAQIKEELIPIYIMGKKYEVPKGLTIMKAMEYAGYKFIRGCGCRGGICGACSTVYRMPGDYHIRTALACQTEVQPEMYLTQIPFYPANRATYDFEQLKPTPEEVFKLYPEVFRCVACNACTKVCPMEVEVMDAVAAIKKGDIAQAAELTFECIQCGLCASRCMGELPQYHIFQLARRIHGAKIVPRAEHLRTAAEKVKEGSFDGMLEKLMAMERADLEKTYVERDWEPETAGEDWRPTKETEFLLEPQD